MTLCVFKENKTLRWTVKNSSLDCAVFREKLTRFCNATLAQNYVKQQLKCIILSVGLKT